MYYNLHFILFSLKEVFYSLKCFKSIEYLLLHLPPVLTNISLGKQLLIIT